MYNILIILFLLIIEASCGNAQQEKDVQVQKSDNMETITHQQTNKLINETSPYLLQHAHNPVNWYPWGEEALQKAKQENKLLIISIGYAACHWCHVMEHESFEDTTVARIMNENFICIKVDREERPDIDQIYMNAVQMLTGSGGWPLNCFALPDGKPIHGGTYFPKDYWKQVLISVANFYKDKPQEALKQAENLTNGIQTSGIVQLNTSPPKFNFTDVDLLYNNWKQLFDNWWGGPNRAPKFPLPNNFLFLLRYYYHTKNQTVLDYFNLTLTKMAQGGIYDHVGGGFARYSTDKYWKAPHFEKMLYDNGQLVSLYSEAFQLTKNPLYKQVVYETLEFVERELTSPEGAFYSSLDADSEGEEGKYYVWTKKELAEILKDNEPMFSEYYSVSTQGNWEHGLNILHRTKETEEIKKLFKITEQDLQNEIQSAKRIILKQREKRVRPGLDDKILTSWNALILKGYIDAYRVFNDNKFLNAGLKNINFILNELKKGNCLSHSHKNGKTTINGYLEDYCFIIDALINLYEATFEEKWLYTAKELMDYTIEHFYDEATGMFFFTSKIDTGLIARKMEIHDNVIPASNSSIAICLFKLSKLFDNADYLNKSAQMLNNIKPDIAGYGSGYSNWAILLLDFVKDPYEVVIAGKEALNKRIELDTYFIPNKILSGSTDSGTLPLLKNKLIEGETLIYVCENKVCKLPLQKVAGAVELILKK